MKKSDKLDYLQTNHLGEWLNVFREEENTLSAKQSLFCVCGRIATGLHEQMCGRFKEKVTSAAIGRLKHHLPKSQEVTSD